jgi:hypothetical protein
MNESVGNQEHESTCPVQYRDGDVGKNWGGSLIVINGILCVSAKSAALAHGFTCDYLARRCREGVIRGSLVARRWYVDPASLQQFIEDAERQETERRQRLLFTRARERKLGRIITQREVTCAP